MQTSSLSNVSSPPITPASSIGPGAARHERNTLDGSATPFVPGAGKKVTIKNALGQEVDLKNQRPPPSPTVPNSPARRPPIRMETEEERLKRLAVEEERVKKEVEKARKEAEEKERKEAEERERKRREEEERERAKKAAEEKERLRKEAEEKERLRKEAEEQERLRKEEEEQREKLRREEEAREQEKLRKEEEQRVQREAEEAERARKEAEEKAKAAAAAAPEPQPSEATEEGEVEETPADKSAPADETKDKPAEKASLRIDTTILNGDGSKRRPGPLDLSGAKPTSMVSAGPSVLANARHIDDFSQVTYPAGVSSPIAENAPAAHKPRHYSRDFLLQFMPICTEKPDNLPPLDVLGLQPDQSYQIARGGSSRRQASVSGSMGPPANAARAQAAVSGLGISGIGGKSGSGFNMGQFATPANKLSSDERFAMSNRSSSISSSGPGGMPFGRPTPMVRSSSQGGPGGTGMGHRTRSKRGEKRGESKTNANASQTSSSFGPAGVSQLAGVPLEPVAPLEISANRWQAGSTRKAAAADGDSPEVVERKVKALLNKLTMERFDSISDQIIGWANKSETEKDGRILIQVDRKSTRLNSSHSGESRMPSSA